MSVESPSDSCAELREQIRHLEEELQTLDVQLGRRIKRVELPEDRVSPGSVDHFAGFPRRASDPKSSPAPAEDDDDVISAQLRSGSAATLYRKVGFRDGREPLERGRRDGKRWRWAGMGLFLVMATGLSLFLLSLRADEASLREAGSTAEGSGAGGGFLDQELEEAGEVLRTFFRAETVDEVLAHVRQAEALESLIRTHHGERPLRAQEMEILEPLKRVRHGRSTYAVGSMRPAGSDEDGRLVAVELGEEGPKVDWELAVNVQRPDWVALVEDQRSRASAGPFRVELEPGDYFSGSFLEETWVCFRARVPESEKVACVYAPRKSALGDRLQALVSDAGETRLTLTLAGGGVPDAMPQCRVVEVIEEGWLLAAENLPLRRGGSGSALASVTE